MSLPKFPCQVICEYGHDVGVPCGPHPEVCGRCDYYNEPIVPPVFMYERHAPIANLNDPIPKCGSVCLYGSTRMDMCGGCCACLGACQVEYENQQIAPFLWEGDYA